MASAKKVVKPEPAGRTQAKALTVRIRNRRATVAADKAEATTGTNAQQIAQLQRQMNHLQGLVLAQARLLALVTDPTAGDLTDDGD